MLRNLGISIQPAPGFVIRNIGDQLSPVKGSVTLDINLTDGLPLSQELAVVDDYYMAYCLLLGADFISNNRISIDYQDKKIRLPCGKEFPLQELDGEHRYAFPIEVQGSEIPRGVREIVIGKAENSLRYKLEYNGGESPCVSPLFTLEGSRMMQRSSQTLSALRKALEGDCTDWSGPVSKFKKFTKELFVRKGLILHGSEPTKTRLVIDLSLLVEVVLVFHYHMAHIGRNKVLDLVRAHVWHPNVNMVVEDVTQSCLVCQKGKPSVLRYPPVHKIETAYPGELVAVDILTLPRSIEGDIGLLVAVDHYSKWVSAVPIKNKTAKTVARALERRILPNLVFQPVKLLSDNGLEFVGAMGLPINSPRRG